MWIAQGKLSEAWGWAREHGVTTADELIYLHEFEHATLARLLLAQGLRDGLDHDIEAAIELTERLLAAAEDGARNGSAIDLLVVQALARHAAGDVAGSLASLQRAVALAEPEGYVRVFLDEGPSMLALLKPGCEAAGSSALHTPAAGRRCHGRTTRGRRTAADRTAQRAGARGPAPPGQRPPWTRDCARAQRVAGHRANAHQEHLRQARREQPDGRRPPRR